MGSPPYWACLSRLRDICYSPSGDWQARLNGALPRWLGAPLPPIFPPLPPPLQVVERFTAHYVFLLGVSRFFSCAHWILQV